MSARRAVLLLVATDWEDAPAVIERLCQRCEEAGGNPQRIRFQTQAIRPLGEDFDWQSLFRETRARRGAGDEAPADADPSVGEPAAEAESVKSTTPDQEPES